MYQQAQKQLKWLRESQLYYIYKMEQVIRIILTIFTNLLNFSLYVLFVAAWKEICIWFLKEH